MIDLPKTAYEVIRRVSVAVPELNLEICDCPSPTAEQLGVHFLASSDLEDIAGLLSAALRDRSFTKSYRLPDTPEIERRFFVTNPTNGLQARAVSAWLGEEIIRIDLLLEPAH